jgi:amino acid transporter
MQKQFALAMLLGFIAFLTIFLFVVFMLSPEEGTYAIITFFGSLTLATICFISLTAYLLRRKASNNEIYFKNVRSAIRESLLFALFIDTILFLGIINLLTWWDALLLAGALILLEMYFLSSNKQPQHLYKEERIL